MADIPFCPSAAYKATHHVYDGAEYETELSEVPRSRAPYTSFRQGYESLGNEGGRAPSYEETKDGESTVRVVSQTPTVISTREKRRKLQGWKFGVTVSAWVAFTVLMLNLILTIYAAVKFPADDGVGIVYEGNCNTVNRTTTGLHVLINALSSILLSASNYTMQCLCSPTRQEINKAHARGDWLDIGVASVRNIFKIKWTRSTLWWVLALSSIPIHLLYNSAVFKSLSANDYSVVVANPAFLAGRPFYNRTYSEYESEGIVGYMYGDLDVSVVQELQGNFSQATRNGTSSLAAGYANLSASDCIAAYGTSFVSGYFNVLAMTNEQGNFTNNTVFYDYIDTLELDGSDPSYDWICSDLGVGREGCDIAAARRNASNWTLNNKKIEYCLVQTAEPHCKLQFSVQILAVVICMNLGKVITMFMTLYFQKDATIVTVGDAMASFLDDPDPLTKGRCLMSKVDVHKGPLRWRLIGVKNQPHVNPPAITYYAPMRWRWFAAASVRRWSVTMTLCGSAIIIAAGLLGDGYSSTASYTGSPFSLGFGTVDSRSIIDIGLPQGGASGLVSAVLLANLPQAMVSFLYLTYNGLFTSMLLAHEYSKYGMSGRRKPLRVTTPRGQQRSTYYLQLPYAYSIPLIIASGTLHWLISESIFLARVTIFDGQDSSTEVSEVGYSCLPILLCILLGTAMLAIAIGMGFRRFASHIPVAGSCSVALAAAAHRPEHDIDAAYLPVQWGEVYDENTGEVGHCCFTSEPVSELIPGRMYAGLSSTSQRFHQSTGWLTG